MTSERNERASSVDCHAPTVLAMTIIFDARYDNKPIEGRYIILIGD